MNEPAARIVEFERRVMWRRRLLSLQDEMALALAVGILLAALVVLLGRLLPFPLTAATIIGAAGLPFAVTLTHWFLTRARIRDAAFLIDESLKLEDRIATSHLIIQRGGPARAMEEAVIESAAELINNQRAASVVPFRMRRSYGLSLVSLIALAAVLVVPQRFKQTEPSPAERANIESAADHLERTAAEVEQIVPPDSETARLTTEQAELGSHLRRSATSSADVLKKLGALEEKIRRRHAVLASTHADEIVTLAEQRLRGGLSNAPMSERKKQAQRGDDLANLNEASAKAPLRQSGKESEELASRSVEAPDLPDIKDRAPSKRTSANRVPNGEKPPKNQSVPAKQEAEQRAQKQPREPVGASRPKPDSSKLETGPAAEGKTSEEKQSVQPKPEAKRPGDQPTREQQTGAERAEEKPTDAMDALKAVPTSAAEQTAKMLPKVSEELLKKAAQLRADQLTAADIERLRQAAESLSNDLARIAQSKELRQALEQMARQVKPEQIEQVARELGGQEKLKQELDAAGRLLAENQHARELAAGLAQQVAQIRDEKGQEQRQNSAGQRGVERSVPSDERGRFSAPNSGRGKANGTLLGSDARKLIGQGRETNLRGKPQQAAGGHYLYLQSKAGAGAARAPYSSAYPQYRRDAERSVGRSQVPPNLRSVIRKYFDAINPDAKR